MPDSTAYLSFAGLINHDACTRIMTCTAGAVSQGFDTMHLLIQSSGGIVEDGIALYNFLRGSPINVVTHNAGGVQSIAIIVYLAGQVRKCASNAMFMAHRSTFTLPQNVDADGLRDRLAYLRLADENTASILRAHVTLPEDKWKAYLEGDLYISAADAKSYGLVHEIADFAPPPGSKMFGI